MTTLDPRGLEAAIDEITGWTTDCGMEPRAWETLQHHDARDIASAAVTAYLDAAYPVVTTMEELEESPVGTVIRDKYGDVCEKRSGWWIRYEPGLIDTASMVHSLPARVIWRPHESA